MPKDEYLSVCETCTDTQLDIVDEVLRQLHDVPRTDLLISLICHLLRIFGVYSLKLAT